MSKLFAILATTAAIAAATPALAQNIDVRVGDGMHRHHRSAIVVQRPRHVVVVREHRHWDRGRHEGWRHAQRGPVVIER